MTPPQLGRLREALADIRDAVALGEEEEQARAELASERPDGTP